MKYLTIKQLKSICKNNKIKGYSNKRKDQLIDLIIKNNIDVDIEPNTKNKTTNKYKNNEAFGITCEYITCKLYGLENKLEDRIITRGYDKLYNTLSSFKDEFEQQYNQTIKQFNGVNNDSVDFFCEYNKSLSMKSNFKKSGKVCPQDIGQPTKKSFIKRIKKFYIFKDVVIAQTNDGIKQFIINNINQLVPLYFKKMFCCDYTIWIYGNKNGEFHYKIIDLKNIKYPFVDNKFTFTKNLINWNEGNTLKYNGISIGEFQVHRNRDCIKFRFYINKVLESMK
jgi:hypothetical protein